jgi:hypothetical protein
MLRPKQWNLFNSDFSTTWSDLIELNYWLIFVQTKVQNITLNGLCQCMYSAAIIRKLRFDRIYIVDILYTLDSASNYSAIQKSKP